MPTKKFHNKQHDRNEERILRGYLAEIKRTGGRKRITLTGISKASGVPYRTIQDHYKNIDELDRKHIDTVVASINTLADESRSRNDDAEAFLRKLLILISKMSVHFEIEYYRKSFLIWEHILLNTRDILSYGWTSYGQERDDKIYRQYSANFIGIMLSWGKYDFCVSRLEQCLTSLAHLTSNATKQIIYCQ